MKNNLEAIMATYNKQQERNTLRDTDKATDRQIERLESLGMSARALSKIKTVADARVAIQDLTNKRDNGPATAKQQIALLRYQFDAEIVGSLTFSEASQLLDQVIKQSEARKAEKLAAEKKA